LLRVGYTIEPSSARNIDEIDADKNGFPSAGMWIVSGFIVRTSDRSREHVSFGSDDVEAMSIGEPTASVDLSWRAHHFDITDRE
jgi:hypothetical protein